MNQIPSNAKQCCSNMFQVLIQKRKYTKKFELHIRETGL